MSSTTKVVLIGILILIVIIIIFYWLSTTNNDKTFEIGKIIFEKLLIGILILIGGFILNSILDKSKSQNQLSVEFSKSSINSISEGWKLLNSLSYNTSILDKFISDYDFQKTRELPVIIKYLERTPQHFRIDRLELNHFPTGTIMKNDEVTGATYAISIDEEGILSINAMKTGIKFEDIGDAIDFFEERNQKVNIKLFGQTLKSHHEKIIEAEKYIEQNTFWIGGKYKKTMLKYLFESQIFVEALRKCKTKEEYVKLKEQFKTSEESIFDLRNEILDW